MTGKIVNSTIKSAKNINMNMINFCIQFSYVCEFLYVFQYLYMLKHFITTIIKCILWIHN